MLTPSSALPVTIQLVIFERVEEAPIEIPLPEPLWPAFSIAQVFIIVLVALESTIPFPRALATHKSLIRLFVPVTVTASSVPLAAVWTYSPLTSTLLALTVMVSLPEALGTICNG